MPTKCVIFDCDGTLVDSEPLGNEVFSEMLVAHGLRLSGPEAMARFRGMKLSECLAAVESQIGRNLPESFVPELRRRTAAAFQERLKPTPGALDLVKSLITPICVASSGPREKIELSLSLTGLLPFFTGRIFSSYEVGSWKPNPGIFLHAAERMGAEPNECTVVEDSLPGISAGLAAGMRVFAFQPDSIDSRIPAGIPVFQTMAQLHRVLIETAS